MGGHSAIPVELTSFSAAVDNNSVKLNWQTSTELNNNGFEILREVMLIQISLQSVLLRELVQRQLNRIILTRIKICQMVSIHTD